MTFSKNIHDIVDAYVLRQSKYKNVGEKRQKTDAFIGYIIKMAQEEMVDNMIIDNPFMKNFIKEFKLDVDDSDR